MTDAAISIDPVSPRASFGGSVFFWALVFFVMFWALGVRELWTAESRWAEVTRNMLLSGDYFHPRINGEPYFDKPLGGYWTIALASKLTGGVNEWAIRMPSAIAGIVALWATIYLGRRLWVAEAGRIAGWILLGCYGFLFWARTGQADMENLAFSLLAIAWYWGRRDRAGFWTSLVFYVICFVGAQMKGLGAIAVPCIAVLPDLLRGNRWRHFLTFSHLAALAVGSAFYFAPFAVESITRGSYAQGGLNLVFQQNVQRFFDPFDHKEPFFVYLYYLPIHFLPWAPLLVIALIAAARRGRRLFACDYPTRWIMEASLLVFLFFTASGSRRGYYILPLLPFCALLCARFLLSAQFVKERRIALGIQKNIVLVMAIGGSLFCAAWPIVSRLAPIPIPGGFVVSLAAISFLGLAAALMDRWRPALLARMAGTAPQYAGALVATAVLMGGYLSFSHVSLDSARTTRRFVESIRTIPGVPTELAFYQVTPIQVATVVYYLGAREPHPVLQTGDQVVRFLSDRPGVNGLLINRGALQKLGGDLPPGLTLEEVAAESSLRWEESAEKPRKWVLVRALHQAD